MTPGLFYAVVSGMLAAMASASGKMAAASSDARWLCGAVVTPAALDCDSILLYVRGSCFLLVFLLNAVMWTVFTKALRLSPTTLSATITNLASNLFFTALTGRLLFGETLGATWFVGAGLIVTGVALIHNAAADAEREAQRKTS
ncbi:PREDICTED: transmembrane protein 42-like isoform X2 [Priapulus caudatus]|uniref:Transmembrane protein 42-like isoform X1 n=1 Tax=Priapulus caudatus TaxID=37621 RepID=A0ABM1EKD0_PRICU|nr:PREDICTED: transmembrane protein 42-like isoform X1 [Priapulus caudatus]XP_014672652.1 PREDICTED: transmembrane protein 42-like isoform X2 [Priapulus caudatus]